MNFRPNEDRVLILPLPTDSKVGSIFIPDTAKEKPLKGTVAAVGDTAGKRKVDDKVLFGKYAGSELVIDSVSYLIMRSTDIFGTVERF